MKKLLRSRILLAGLFGLVGAVAALAATGNLPGVSEDPSEEPRHATTSRTTDASGPGTAFTTHPESAPPRAAVRGPRYSSEDDYRDQLYEQYFGYEEEEDEDEPDYELIQPGEDGGGSGQPGEPGEPGIPDDDDGSGAGTGGEGGPGGGGG